jgi:hypothetical protein
MSRRKPLWWPTRLACHEVTPEILEREYQNRLRALKRTAGASALVLIGDGGLAVCLGQNGGTTETVEELLLSVVFVVAGCLAYRIVRLTRCIVKQGQTSRRY